jgi:hypothetical protein
MSASVKRTLTSKPAAPGQPVVDVTATFVDRQASKLGENCRDDYTAGGSRGRGDWFPVIASTGVKFPLGKSKTCSATVFVEAKVQLSNRQNRDDHNVAGGVRFACGGS